ncbi:MAG: hypothetical protein O3B42_03950 [Actinomycetota bacterium]|nr:hypothetical protein [Actinomycetota bacterium]
MAESKQPLSSRIADLLEMIATKVRALTVDRAAAAITWIAVSIMLVVALSMALFWLLVGIFRALGALMGTETAYAVVGAVLILAGAVIWMRRYPQDRKSHQE